MKNAIVTGGTKGIGLGIAKALLREGYFVYITYAGDQAAAQQADTELSAISLSFSIHCVNQADINAVHLFAQSLAGAPINCIVCNAGTTVRKATQDITDEDWNRMMQVNVNSHFFLIRDLWLQIQPASRLIFIGSMMAIQPHATSLPYAVTKAALHAMAKNLVKDFEGTETTVNVIAPGFVETDWQKNKPQEIRERICAKTAIHRFATIEEIADTALFLLHNPFVNGTVIEVSGGYCYK